MGLGKVNVTKRSKPRVETTEERSKAPTKKSERGTVKGNITPVPEEGVLVISAQIAETVPVAQYANVILGPVQFSWALGGVDMATLCEVEDWDELTDEQQEAYDRARGGARATMTIIEHVISEDRETVERSVREHNKEVEAAEKKKNK